VANRRPVPRSKQAPPLLLRSVLSRPDILKRIEKGDLAFDPKIDLGSVKQCSIDLRLGRTFTVFKKEGHVGAYRLQNARALFEKADLWEQHEEEFLTLRPGRMVLAQSVERVHLSNDLMGLVEGRSSWARFGVGVHITAPKIDPGYGQPITLELFNLSEAAYELQPEVDQPCQLMLMQVSTALGEDEIYGSLQGRFLRELFHAYPGKRNKNKPACPVTGALPRSQSQVYHFPMLDRTSPRGERSRNASTETG
jgi:dCTP deaminase